MSRFKDAIAQDVKQTFINPAEFAVSHVINGKEIVCVIDKFLTTEATDTITSPLEGVFVNALTIYVETGVIPKPIEGEVLMLDDRMCLVKSVSDEMGVLAIVVEANEQ